MSTPWARLGPSLGPAWARLGPSLGPAWAKPKPSSYMWACPKVALRPINTCTPVSTCFILSHPNTNERLSPSKPAVCKLMFANDHKLVRQLPFRFTNVCLSAAVCKCIVAQCLQTRDTLYIFFGKCSPLCGHLRVEFHLLPCLAVLP